MIRLSSCFLPVFFLFTGAAGAVCPRFDEAKSSAYDGTAGAIVLPWRTDYPASAPPAAHPWEAIDFELDWRAYMDAALDEVRASGVSIENMKITMTPGAEWWIAPWMDYSASGREPMLGLTQERGPDPKDLSPTSTGGDQVWAIGWYNRDGAAGLGQVFADPCDPAIPGTADGEPWTFPDGAVAFKLLFTDAPVSEVPYLAHAPMVEALVYKKGGGAGGGRRLSDRVKRALRLLQVDIAVRDPRASETSWVMGTFVWNPDAGAVENFLDGLIPVGLMWGNDPGVYDPDWSKKAALAQSRINDELEGVVWGWPERPYPGFQGRLNGPADNLKSSCLSCHALGQWQRNATLGIVPRYGTNPPPDATTIAGLVDDYFGNARGGTLVKPDGSTPLDYSLQIEAGFTRLCRACNDEAMSGETPAICRVSFADGRRARVNRDRCERSLIGGAMNSIASFFSKKGEEPPPRQ